MNMVWCHIAHLGCEKGAGVRTTYGPDPRSKGGLKIFLFTNFTLTEKKNLRVALVRCQPLNRHKNLYESLLNLKNKKIRALLLLSYIKVYKK